MDLDEALRDKDASDRYFARKRREQEEWQAGILADVPAAMAKMSKSQKSILLWLHQRYQEGVNDQWQWGAVWKTGGMSRSDQASISRAVARLEARGFLLRQNNTGGSPGCDHIRYTPEDLPPIRTSRLQLMPAGRAAAELLSKPPSQQTVNIGGDLVS